MQNTLEATLDHLYEMMTWLPEDKQKTVFTLVGFIESDLQRLKKWGAEEYVEVAEDDWLMSLGELNQLGVATPTLPEAIVRRDGSTVHVAKNLYSLVDGILDGSINKESFEWYINGITDFTEGSYADPE
jgi:hypothetical protein